MSQERRAIHPPKGGVAPVFPPPLSRLCLECFLDNRRKSGGGGCRTAPARGVAGKSPSENGSHYTGVSRLHSHQPRYTVPLRAIFSPDIVHIFALHVGVGGHGVTRIFRFEASKMSPHSHISTCQHGYSIPGPHGLAPMCLKVLPFFCYEAQPKVCI